MTDRPSSPTPEERRKADEELKVKEAAEQALLPYKWTQTIKDVDITVPVSASLRGKDLDVVITKTKLKVAIKGQSPIIDVWFPGPSFTSAIDTKQDELSKPVRVDDCTWTLETTKVGKDVSIHLDKANQMEWWPSVVTSGPKIDTSKITPENSKLGDLDGETRSMVEKMMYDQRQKELGKPTSEEAKKMEMLEAFKKQHPEMDFSKAKMG